jgi:hypothetical protein
MEKLNILFFIPLSLSLFYLFWLLLLVTIEEYYKNNNNSMNSTNTSSPCISNSGAQWNIWQQYQQFQWPNNNNSNQPEQYRWSKQVLRCVVFALT